MIDDLYSAKILKLAANMPGAGRLDAPEGSATRVAKLCGSRVTVDVALDSQGRVSRFAQDVKACALGQASAAVLGYNFPGSEWYERAYALINGKPLNKSSSWFSGLF